jgi:hypothetical protein
MGDHFWFGSIFITKKNNQTEIFLKKPKPFQIDLFRFGLVFLDKTGLAGFFSGLVRFGFFSFRLIKPKPNRTSWFFQNFNRFFSRFGFFDYFFPDFLGFLVFLLTPIIYIYIYETRYQLFS